MSEDERMGTLLRDALEQLPAPTSDLADVARRAGRFRVRRRAGLAAVAILAAVGITLPLLVLFPLSQEKPHPHRPASSGTSVSGEGLSIDLAQGWDGRAYYNSDGGVAVLQFANFPLVPVPPAGPEDDVASRSRSDMGPGQVVVVLTEYVDCRCPSYEQAELPISLQPSPDAGIDGGDPGHAFARRTFTFGGRFFDLWADFGSDPAPPALLDEVNNALTTLVIAPAQLQAAQEGWVTHLDLQDGVSVDTPSDWSFNHDPVPVLLGPRVLFAVGTWPVPTGGECLPSTAAHDLPADGALLWVMEYGGTGADGGFKADDFPPRSGGLQLGPLTGPLECLGEKAQEVLWQQGGRYFQAFAMFGPDGSPSEEHDLLQALNSVQPFDTSCESQVVRPGEYRSQFSATSGAPGDTVTVTGTLPWPPLNEGGQYVPQDRTDVWWNDQFPESGLSPPQGNPEQLASQPVNGTCRYSLTFRVPDVPAGTYPLTIRDYEGGGYGWIGWTDFVVTG
jgi:hypothetical protein